MRAGLSIALICLLSGVALGQSQFNENRKSFVGLSVGFGSTQWRSKTADYRLFDRAGFVIRDGDFKIKARNAHQSLQLETLSPMNGGKWRLGMGIQFEEYSLYRITVEDEGQPNVTLPYVERFRFDKFFVQVEWPLKWPESRYFHINPNFQGGWYGFSGVNSLSLFGSELIGQTWFGSVAAVLDFQIADRVYLVAKPTTTYKYFHNTRDDDPGSIRHRWFDFSLLGGIRVHVL